MRLTILIPIAGRGERLSLPLPKELLPIGAGKVAIDAIFDMLRPIAPTINIVVIFGMHKLETVKYLAKYQKLAEEINGGAKKGSKSPKSPKSKPSKSPKSPKSPQSKSPKSPQSNSPKKAVNRKTPEKKDSEKNKSEKKDSEKKDSEKNKSEKKDSEKKNSEKKDSEKKNSEKKDSEKKDSEKEPNNLTESSPSYTQILKTETPDNKQNQLNLNSSNTETKNDVILQPKKIDDNYFNLTDSSSSYSNIFYKTY